mgnify:FL=1
MAKYHITEKITPIIDITSNLAMVNKTILFDWIPFEIPRGTCRLANINMLINNTDSTAAQGGDINFYFAKSIGGVAPLSLGTQKGTATASLMQTLKSNIIGTYFMDFSEAIDNLGLKTISMLSTANAIASDKTAQHCVLQGENNYPGATTGYQTIWVAATVKGTAMDLGTGVLLDQAGHQAQALATATSLTIDGTVAGRLFKTGDTLQAFVAADGSGVKKIGKVVDFDTNTILVDQVLEAFTDDMEICNTTPMEFTLALEY